MFMMWVRIIFKQRYRGDFVPCSFIDAFRFNAPILQDICLPRPYYCLEEIQDSNTYCTEGPLSICNV